MPHDRGDALTELSALAPGVGVLESPRITVAGVAPAVGVRPTSVAELGQTMGWASKKGMAVAALGGGTKLGVGNPPSRLDLVVETGAMASVLEYVPEDLILTAQAGATIGQLRSTAAADSLVLPLDPPSADRATLGGVLACADHGPRRRQYGGLRDVVLGMKVVLPDGKPATFGGRTLKNVAGYDVGKLFIGSLGTIGIIAEVTLRLLPRPADEELLLVFFPGLTAGRDLVAKILGSPLLPSSLEALSPACAGLLDLDRLGVPAGAYVMLIALQGHSADVARQVRDISAFCSELDSGAGRTGSLRGSEIGLPPSDGWQAFGGLRAKALEDPTSVGLRCAVPLARVWELAEASEEAARAGDVSASYTMGCGTGYMEVFVSGPAPRLRTFAVAVRGVAEKLEGAATVLSGWSALDAGFDAWGITRTDFGLMRAIKQRFDPGGVMNPGRFVGGL